jgi:hypothetical protein
MGSDKEDLQRWADLVLDGKPINIDQTLRHQAATIADLREALRVLADDLYRLAKDTDDVAGAAGDTPLSFIGNHVWNNPIAAAAVRKASDAGE